jgi:F-type H+-transporting ATPase subunit delta
MPKFTSNQYAEALYDSVHQTHEKDHDKVMDNFVKILAQNGDLGKYEEIAEAYKIMVMKEKGLSQAQVTVAQDMEISRSVIDELNKITGSKLEIKKKVDSGIVGGVVVRVDDTLIDASVKNQLNNLNKSLKN